MCGILGYCNLKGYVRGKLDIFEQALRILAHRGPDFYNTIHWEKVIFGHRRLSIIDLTSSANQPMIHSSQKVAIVYNGEVYNYKNLAKKFGISPVSSDTKAILEAYVRHGSKIFRELRGIYAFSIFDFRKEAKIILVRDPSGIKPLYYYHKNGEFSFASEIKPLKKIFRGKLSLNEAVLPSYISLGYVPEPQTIYKEIKALDPGHVMEYSLESGSAKNSPFYLFDFNHVAAMDEAVAIKETQRLLKKAVDRNLVSDASLSVSLSGGIDSTLIYAMANGFNSVKGYTISTEEKGYDESEIASACAKHLAAEHEILSIQTENSLELLDKLLLHFDQPYGDSSLIPFYYMTKTAAQKTRVLVGGDGADEVYSGYAGQLYIPLLEKFKPYKFIFSALKKLLRVTKNSERIRQMEKISQHLNSGSLEENTFLWISWLAGDNAIFSNNNFSSFRETSLNLFKSSSHSENLKVQEWYFKIRMLSDHLRKSDMMSMINSVEYRVPMLDEDLVQFGLSLPVSLKADVFKQKKILRKLHREYYPTYISKLKKKGFTIPLDSWLGQENLQIMLELLSKKGGLVSEYLSMPYLKTLEEALLSQKHRHLISRASAYQQLLILYSLQLWSLNESD